MPLARVSLFALGCALVAACGERAGDPIVQVASGSQASGAGGSLGKPGQQVEDPAAGDTPGGGRSQGPTGLCGACPNSDACGDANDACIRHDNESFCGRDCEEGHGCPDGYACVELDNSNLEQCVPTMGCSSFASQVPDVDDVRSYVLSRINAERLARDRDVLQASPCLDELAQASALDYAWSDVPLGKYVKECNPLWPNCSCGWTAEAEASVAAYGLDWLSAVEQALADDRFARSFTEYEVERVGIGFWMSGDEAWIALSFG